jgi:hypothetical protein
LTGPTLHASEPMAIGPWPAITAFSGMSVTRRLTSRRRPRRRSPVVRASWQVGPACDSKIICSRAWTQSRPVIKRLRSDASVRRSGRTGSVRRASPPTDRMCHSRDRFPASRHPDRRGTQPRPWLDRRWPHRLSPSESSTSIRVPATGTTATAYRAQAAAPSGAPERPPLRTPWVSERGMPGRRRPERARGSSERAHGRWMRARRVSSSVTGAENRDVTHNIFIFRPVTIK